MLNHFEFLASKVVDHFKYFKNYQTFICTKFSLERDGLVKFSTESNGWEQPRGREEKEKLTHSPIRCNL